MFFPSSFSSSCLCTFTFLSALQVSCDALAVQANRAVVRTSKGRITGYAGSEGQRYVVPYAQAPTGTLRFKDPAFLHPTESYDASGLPPACPQPGLDSASEDCLFMSIYTPAGTTSTSSLPVLVWIHGGSFYTGAALDASRLANAQSMIVVAVQYRLGALGFLKNDALGVSGNFGLKDIIMALNYIHTDIRSFGGNPSHVTLAGQSSGAELIKTLLVTPSATPYFARAILQSAPLDFSDQTPTLANIVGGLVASELECTTAACLVDASVDNILAAQAAVIAQGQQGGIAGLSPVATFLRPVADGTLVTRDFKTVVAAGEQLEGPSKKLIFSTMKEEGALAISGLMPSPMPSAAFPLLTEQVYSNRAASVIGSRLYDPTTLKGTDSTRDAFVALSTDYNWVCPTQQTALNITKSRQRVYQAQFNLGISYSNGTIPFTAHRATHQDDIYVLFNPVGLHLTRAQRALVKEVQARWGAFVKTGSPNVAGYRTWRPIGGSDNLNILLLGNGARGNSAVTDVQRTAECALGSGIYTPA